MSPIAVARALYAALEAGRHGEALRTHFTADAETIEHPNRLKPSGARTPLEEMLRSSSAGAGLLARQSYEIHSALEQGPIAALRLTWRGVVARDAGPFAAGHVLTAHIAQFVEVEGERVRRIETFDCYEPS